MLARCDSAGHGAAVLPSGRRLTDAAQEARRAVSDGRAAVSRLESDFLDGLLKNRSSFLETARTYESAENIVFTVKLCGLTDTHRLAMERPNKYVRQRFAPACIVRYKWHRSNATLLLFHSGKVVCVGVRNREEALFSCHMLRLELDGRGYRTIFFGVKEENRVWNKKLPYCIDLAKLYKDYQERCGYDPERFPGLVYKMGNTPSAMRVFDSGQCVLMGTKDKDACGKIWRFMADKLSNYVETDGPSQKDRFEFRNRRKAEVFGLQHRNRTKRTRDARLRTTAAADRSAFVGHTSAGPAEIRQK